MTKWLSVVVFISLFICCKQKTERKEELTPIQVVAAKKELFFPVTNYLRGQLNSISEAAINPVMYVTTDNKTDSSWLKIEYLQREAQPFLQPEIDSTNLANFFEEKRFLDQTINAFTFSYDPLPTRPKGFALQRWDVYVDPTTNKVKRIYMVKTAAENKTQQLTWQTDKWFKIVTIGYGNNNISKVEKEVLIKWDF